VRLVRRVLPSVMRPAGFPQHMRRSAGQGRPLRPETPGCTRRIHRHRHAPPRPVMGPFLFRADHHAGCLCCGVAPTHGARTASSPTPRTSRLACRPCRARAAQAAVSSEPAAARGGGQPVRRHPQPVLGPVEDSICCFPQPRRRLLWKSGTPSYLTVLNCPSRPPDCKPQTTPRSGSRPRSRRRPQQSRTTRRRRWRSC
jgi:hypothetical protein